jgi:hypothetical protein
MELLTRLQSSSAILWMMILAPVSINAQALSGPDGGFFFDSASKSIRAISGLPPASQMGRAVVDSLPGYASIAPNGKAALFSSGDGVAWISDLATDPVQRVELIGTLSSPSRIVWAPDSTAAILFSQSGEFQIVSTTPGSRIPSVGQVIVGQDLGSDIRFLAADPLQGLVLVAAQGSVYLLAQDGSAAALGAFDREIVSACISKAGVVYATPANSRELWRLQSGVDPLQVLASAGDTASLVIDEVRNQVLLADRSDMKIHVYSMTDWSEVQLLDLDAKPSSAEQFAPGAFILNSTREAGEPLLILQISEQYRVLFVPDPWGKQQ